MGIVVSSFSNAQRTPRVYGEYIQPYDMGMLQYGLENINRIIIIEIWLLLINM